MTENVEMQASETVSTYWGDERKEFRKHSWLEHPVTRAFLNQRISGDPQVGTVDYWQRKYLPKPVPLALSLGCGFGNLERHAMANGIAHHIDACDISEGAVAQARIYAEEAGFGERITYSVRNLDKEDLPKAHYDAIFAISSVHHVFELETMFRRCRDALKPGGLFYLDEYIGPSRFQCSPKAVALINRLLAVLPSRYRKSVYLNNQQVTTYTNPSVRSFEENDPSESIRSGEIVATLKHYFDIVEIRPYGGSILHMLLAGTAGNFDPDAESDAALLSVLAILEETLEDAGVLNPDFAAIVAKPRFD